ncbi:hypothetical protein G7046_g9139 [Stylonectria norvegica]|nr:hypothetical protein G7046_g9139 [Stylonectria norvegica]
MSTKILNYLAGGKDGAIRIKKTTRELGDLDVYVRITHSGVCGTDEHDRIDGCGLGHEGIGIVEEVGKSVTRIQIGQRVGCGWQTSSCGQCRECIAGYRAYCPKSIGQKYGDPTQGTFGNYAIRHEDFVWPIPDGIDSKYAGPLICAGITVFEGLLAASTKPTDRVGVIGLGGLGHLAVMYARAMGCHVTVFSSRLEKKADAMKLGASDFRLFPANRQSPSPPTSVDAMLVCGGSLTTLEDILPLLARRARVVLLSIQMEDITVPASTAASNENAAAALAFAARHSIKPWIEEFAMSPEGLECAFKKLHNGTISYRAILNKELGNALN